MVDQIDISFWAVKAAQYVAQYIKENPPYEEELATIIQKCYDKYANPKPEAVVDPAKIEVTQPVHAPEDFQEG